jgi:hypothetical protein
MICVAVIVVVVAVVVVVVVKREEVCRCLCVVCVLCAFHADLSVCRPHLLFVVRIFQNIYSLILLLVIK